MTEFIVQISDLCSIKFIPSGEKPILITLLMQLHSFAVKFCFDEKRFIVHQLFNLKQSMEYCKKPNSLSFQNNNKSVNILFIFINIHVMEYMWNIITKNCSLHIQTYFIIYNTAPGKIIHCIYKGNRWPAAMQHNMYNWLSRLVSMIKNAKHSITKPCSGLPFRRASVEMDWRVTPRFHGVSRLDLAACCTPKDV